MTTTPSRPVLRTQADLERVWRHLMEPLGFSRSSIWLMLIDSGGQPLPQLTEIEDCDAPPTPGQLAGLVAMLDDLRDDAAPQGRWAFLRSRPGAGAVTDLDRAWARGLVEACRERGLPCEVVHLATDVDVVPLPYDVLAHSA